jgi:methionyl aminopeptidase
MAFTVEPMFNAGTSAIRTDADGRTTRTADGALPAQFEHTVLIGPHGSADGRSGPELCSP